MAKPVLEYLRQLVTLVGPSGAEEEVVQTIARLARPLVDTVELDPLGNLIAIRQAASSDARRCVLAAHMDEVGLRVRKIEPNGFLRFEKVGGTDNRVLLGQRVWVRTGAGTLLGVIGTKSRHLQSEADRNSIPVHTDQYVDIGARSAEDASRMGVEIGDPVGFAGELAELGTGTGRYTAHAIDDRAGCAILLALLDELRDQDLPVTVIAVFTVQEEVGLRGARAAIQRLACDLAIAVDMTATDDTPDTGGNNLRLGGGPAVKLMDAYLLAHPAVRRGMRHAAAQAGVTIQHEILMGIGTDAGEMQFGKSGIPVGVLSTGNRYTHSPVEVVDLHDLEDAVKLLHQFLHDVPEMDLRFTAIE